MRYIIPSLFFSTVAGQVPALVPNLSNLNLSILKLPQKPVLPLTPSPDILSGNGFSSLADSLLKAAQAINVHTDATTVATAQLTGDVSVNPTPNLPTTFDLVKATGGVSATLWQLAFDLENKICAIATSINQQNIAAQQANLATAIQTEVAALLKFQAALNATVAAITSQASAFSSAEKDILTSAVLALVGSVQAAAQPVQILANALQAVGITVLSSLADSLTVQAGALAGFASKVNFIPT